MIYRGFVEIEKSFTLKGMESYWFLSFRSYVEEDVIIFVAWQCSVRHFNEIRNIDLSDIFI